MIPSILPYMATIIALFTAASASLPEQVFWDNDWPSDLISLGEFNNGDDSDKKVLDFLPLENPHVIQGQSNLNEISNDPKAEVLKTIFNDDDNNGEVEVKTWDGSWIKEFYLPDALDIPNLSEFQLTCASSWSVKIHYNNGTTRSVSYGKYLVLAVLNGVWITEDEYDPTPSPSAAPTPFNDKHPLLLKGTVLFAQSQIFPSKHGIDGDSQPHLTALRKTLVMLRPQIETTEDEEEVMLKMTVRDMDKKVISSDIEMKAPNYIPKQDGWIELGNVDPDDIEFPSSLIDPYVIQNQGNLNLIKDDKKATVLTEIMNKPNQAEVEIKTWNGSWVRDIYLPDGSTIPADSKIQITCNSGYDVYMHYPNTQTGGWRSKKITNGQKIVFILVNNVWLSEGDLGHNRYVFGHRFFTAMLKEEWVQQGMSIEFTAISNSDEKDKVGVLHKIEIGGETELVITAIDAGMNRAGKPLGRGKGRMNRAGKPLGRGKGRMNMKTLLDSFVKNMNKVMEEQPAPDVLVTKMTHVIEMLSNDIDSIRPQKKDDIVIIDSEVLEAECANDSNKAPRIFNTSPHNVVGELVRSSNTKPMKKGRNVRNGCNERKRVKMQNERKRVKMQILDSFLVRMTNITEVLKEKAKQNTDEVVAYGVDEMAISSDNDGAVGWEAVP